MNKQKGFTLVEMLVVIAIIGILSATALTAFGPARSKAKDAKIISAMQQIRAIAESLYDGDYDAVTNNQTDISRLRAEIEANGGKSFTISLSDGNGSQAYEVHVTLNNGTIYCVDSSGFSGTSNGGNQGVCIRQ